MDDKYLIKNVTLINEGQKVVSDVLIKNSRFERIDAQITVPYKVPEIDGTDLWLIPGVIDNQVHFREPGLTHKGNIASESRAAAAGGITTFMEMPNTNPPTLSKEKLEEKFSIAHQSSFTNYSFFLGAANDNIEEILRANDYKNQLAGIKVFMGSSTGNMLVDNYQTLLKIFSESELLIATHCEDEEIIRQRQIKYAHANHASYHPIIRNDEACYQSSYNAIQLAQKYHSRLHILHISTEKELTLFGNIAPLAEKRITSEVCVHHLSFNDTDYESLGNLIQCNPSIKSSSDQNALWRGLLNDQLDIIATDHAPHTWEEKQLPYPSSPSGLPLVQHSLLMMLEHAKNGRISYEKVIEKMCHAPAICYQIQERGFIREGYHADAVLIDPHAGDEVNKNNLLYHCGWSPLEGKNFQHRILNTFVNGSLVYEYGKAEKMIAGKGARVLYNRD